MKVTFSFFTYKKREKKKKKKDTRDLVTVMHNSVGSGSKWSYLSPSAFKWGPEYITSKHISSSRTHEHDKWLSRASKDPLGEFAADLKGLTSSRKNPDDLPCTRSSKTWGSPYCQHSRQGYNLELWHSTSHNITYTGEKHSFGILVHCTPLLSLGCKPLYPSPPKKSVPHSPTNKHKPWLKC